MLHYYIGRRGLQPSHIKFDIMTHHLYPTYCYCVNHSAYYGVLTIYIHFFHIRLLVTFETCEVCFKVDLYGFKLATSSFLIHWRFKKNLLQNLSGIITNPSQQEHKLPHFQWPIVCLIFGRVWARTNNHIPQYLSMLSIPVCETQDITYSYIIMPPRHYLN